MHPVVGSVSPRRFVSDRIRLAVSSILLYAEIHLPTYDLLEVVVRKKIEANYSPTHACLYPMLPILQRVRFLSFQETPVKSLQDLRKRIPYDGTIPRDQSPVPLLND